MTNKKNNKTNRVNPLTWFLIAIVIPVVFAIILAYIIFSMAGVDAATWVKDKVSTVPVVSSLVTTEEEKNYQEKNEKLQLAIDEKDNEVEQLTADVESLENVIEQLEKEVLKLKKSADVSNEDLDSDSPDGEGNNENDSLKQTSQTFKDMDPKQAAQIIQRLKKESALSVLDNLSNKVRGKIFEEMEPEKAAELTQSLIDEVKIGRASCRE